MLKFRRMSRSSNGRQKIRKRVVKKEVSSIVSDRRKAVVENITQELATKLSPSIVSLASFDGDKMHFRSTGIVLANSSSGGACVLTSSALVSTSDKERMLTPALKIKLRLPNNEVVGGWIKRYRLPCSMVVIETRFSPDLRAACLNKTVQVEPHSQLLAVKHCFHSGKLMDTRGELIDGPSEVDSEGFMFSTCKITMDGSGGPLVDFDGNIVGMNDYHDQKFTRYVPTNKILESLRDIWLCVDEMEDLCITFKPFRFTEGCSSRVQGSLNQTCSTGRSGDKRKRKDFASSIPKPQEFIEDEHTPEFTVDEHKHPTIHPWPSSEFTKVVNDILRSDGYPLPAYADRGMHLEGDFEEEFGIAMWSEPTRKVASMKSWGVVALASFNGKERHFACTGVSVDCNESTSIILTSASLVRTSGDENKIIDNLRIEVCLPMEQRIIGTLQHYDLSYNVAVVSIPNSCKNHAAIIFEEPQTKVVVALGRAFKSGNLMATDGSVTGGRNKFDCRELKFSTCKITKAGIGGPLFDLNGNFVGMNFYDSDGTPYLPSDIIQNLLRSFYAERLLLLELQRSLIIVGRSLSHIGIIRVVTRSVSQNLHYLIKF
ncbi:unnamed protein product [Triticum turgidum subsp. durum]|uniref:Uncharacterized protein n=1 Tax=Triticum turgidum subsp. durum TaxID=4567 RepID=A0A9R0XCN9_TRITD|nr:unnamed protein product [Triticum turgidum subsp. durum]